MPFRLLTALLITLPVVAACTEQASTDSGDGRTVEVSSTDSACDLSATRAPAGTLTFRVTNEGSQVTEFYLLDEAGETIVGEVENIGPGLTQKLVVSAAEGTYTTACKPGMSGDGIRADFRVTASGADVTTSADEDAKAEVEEATERYHRFVQREAALLLAQTRQFVTAYQKGDDNRARALYPVARTHWERIETVAESFGDLDPKMDAREADLEPGQRWTGWHRIEKDLWPARAGKYLDLTMAQRKEYAGDLLANTVTLRKRIATLTFGLDQIANGSRGLLEEVANGKITGEEEYWSRTDLWDFQANVDGARVAFLAVRPLLVEKDPALARTLTTRFAALQRLLDAQREGDGFRSYDEVPAADIRELAAAVNALSEPLSHLTGAVLE